MKPLTRPQRLIRPWLWLLACCLWTLAHAAQPPSAPQLRIEAGMHTAMIRHIATDAQGRWAVTASDDKTARVWDVATGRLLQTLRPPIAGGNEGKLYAVALSPDGVTVAVAGWTGYDWDKQHSVYLFDRTSARLLRRLSGLPNVVNHLAWSPDGQFLAATLGGKNGVRVWPQPLSGGSPLADSDYGDGSSGAAWSRSGQLATTSWDGQVRLYRVSTQGLNKLTQVRAPGGQRPSGIAYAPQSSELAVGYSDSTRVDILDGATLALRHSPDTSGAGNGNFVTVGWSVDGETLLSGMWRSEGESTLVRQWSRLGRGRPVDVLTTRQDVDAIVPLPNGKMLVAAEDPVWGMLELGINSTRAWTEVGRSPIADFRDMQSNRSWALSPDGLKVQFGYTWSGTESYRFDLSRRSLLPGKDASLPLPRTQGLDVQNWRNNPKPTLAGQPLALPPYETARSLAVAPDSSSFVLGADWWLRHYSAQGKELWKQPVPGVVWGVHIAPAAKLVVAAYADGTIRWHRLSDGKEILAFFPHADRKRWVLWTPSGYYDASPGGEDLIGWHVNRGADAAADFFPASQFRSRFYRPDVIDRILQTGDEAQALAEADAERGRTTQQAQITQVLPPVVEVLSGSDLRSSQPQVTVKVRARTASDAPVTQWQVRVNGQAVPELRNLVAQSASAQEREFQVPIPAQDSEIQIFATNRHATSTPAMVRVSWAGSRPDVAAYLKPKLYVLAVGVSNYQHSNITKLHFAAKDAQDLARELARQRGLLYSEVEVRLLTDSQVTRDSVIEGLDWLQKQVTARDVGMLFLAGHAVKDASLGYVYLPGNANPDKLKLTGVTMADLTTTLHSLAGKAVAFLDTCHAGSVLGPAKRAMDVDINDAVRELGAADSGVVVFSSSTGRQFSYEDPKWGNGAFTKALIEGLQGAAAQSRDGRITHAMLDAYVSERVKKLTQGQQTPVKQAPGGVADFPLVVVK